MFTLMFPRGPIGTGRWLAVVLASLSSAALAQERIVDQSLQVQTAADEAAAKSQVRISQLADQTTNLIGDYRVTTQQLDRVRIYNQNLENLVKSQEEEKSSIKEQLDNFVETEQDIVPMMQNMIDTLAQFIKLDMPFLLGERNERIDRLRDNMDRADVTISEKYRQIMDAYTIEANFGRDVEAYTGPLQLGDGPERQVDFLRVGRMLLAYQTADGSETGFWNKNSREWESLPDSYRRSINDGLSIARKQAAPQMLKVPVPAAEPAQ